MARQGMNPGDRPQDVALVNIVTGDRLPCELSYQGIDSDGLHEWRVDTPFNPSVESLQIGVFPPRTSVVMPMQLPETPEWKDDCVANCNTGEEGGNNDNHTAA